MSPEAGLAWLGLALPHGHGTIDSTAAKLKVVCERAALLRVAIRALIGSTIVLWASRGRSEATGKGRTRQRILLVILWPLPVGPLGLDSEPRKDRARWGTKPQRRGGDATDGVIRD